MYKGGDGGVVPKIVSGRPVGETGNKPCAEIDSEGIRSLWIVSVAMALPLIHDIGGDQLGNSPSRPPRLGDVLEQVDDAGQREVPGFVEHCLGASTPTSGPSLRENDLDPPASLRLAAPGKPSDITLPIESVLAEHAVEMTALLVNGTSGRTLSFACLWCFTSCLVLSTSVFAGRWGATCHRAMP